jgi:hypothetical protein
MVFCLFAWFFVFVFCVGPIGSHYSLTHYPMGEMFKKTSLKQEIALTPNRAGNFNRWSFVFAPIGNPRCSIHCRIYIRTYEQF